VRTRLFAPLDSENRTLAKTGSGQTEDKLNQKERFLAALALILTTANVSGS